MDGSTDPSRQEDEVDAIVAAWHRERPDLDVAPLEVLSRVARISRRLDQARSTVFTEHDLDSWEFDVLSALRRSGKPYQLSPSALVQQTLVTSGTMTTRVSRLETRGYVKREPSPSDRRGVLVQLTDDGRRVLDAAFGDLLAHEKRILEGMPSHEQAQLGSALRSLLASVEQNRT